MNAADAVATVHTFWERVWNAHDPAAVDDFVVDDFVLVSGGETIVGRENFAAWLRDFLAVVDDLRLDETESFANADGSRVASRWLLERASWELSQRLSAR